MQNQLPIEATDIQKLIPHRFPFMLIDRIVAFESGKSLKAIKNITMNEPQFMGHFPDFPVMPGVLIIEAMAQTAAVIEMYGQPEGTKKGVFFMSVESAKFRKPVLPGDQLEMHLVLEQARRNVFRFRGEAKVKGVLHAEAVLTAMIFDEK